MEVEKMSTFEVTVVKSDGDVNKVFPKDEDRDNHLVSGIARTKSFTPQDFLEFLNASDPNTCIITGLQKTLANCAIEKTSSVGNYYEPYGITRNVDGESLQISYRGLDTFTYDRSVNGLLHIDCDNKPGMKYLQPEDLLVLLEGIIPELSSCTKIVKHSSSNVTQKGEESKHGNYHIYIVIPMSHIKAVGTYLYMKMMINGHGHLYHRDNAIPVLGGYIDKTCHSPERIIYIAPPTLKDDNLVYHHKAYIIESTTLSNDLSDINSFYKYDPADIEESFNQAWNNLKNDHREETQMS